MLTATSPHRAGCSRAELVLGLPGLGRAEAKHRSWREALAWVNSGLGAGRLGLSGVALVTSDAHRGLTEAIGATLPGTSWQRCRTRYAANLMPATPKASWPWVKTLLHSVYDGSAVRQARYLVAAGG
jgi:transposase-like protein